MNPMDHEINKRNKQADNVEGFYRGRGLLTELTAGYAMSNDLVWTSEVSMSGRVVVWYLVQAQ